MFNYYSIFFIYDFLNKYDKYGISLSNKMCCYDNLFI